jgi:hypothetical protein
VWGTDSSQGSPESVATLAMVAQSAGAVARQTNGGISPSALRIALGLIVPRSAADSVDAVTHSRSRLKRECEQLENTVNAHERLQIGYRVSQHSHSPFWGRVGASV